MKKENKNKKKIIIIVMVLIIIVIAACVGVMATEGKFSRKDKKGATPTDATITVESEITDTEDVTTEKEKTEVTTTEKTTTEKVEDTEAVVTENQTTESKKEDDKPKTTESSKPKNTEASNPQTTQAPKTTEASNPQTTQDAGCQHNWVEQTKTIHHEAEYSETEVPVYEEHRFCNKCGADLTKLGITETQHVEASGTYMFNAGTEENPDWWEFYNCAGSHGEWIITGYETQKTKVKDAWDETVITGYKCSKCGAVK